MTDLNSVNHVNGVTRVKAEHVNRLMASAFRAEYSNSVSLSGDLTLTDVDFPTQRIDCNGANRVVKVPAGSTSNHQFLLINVTSSGSWTITLKSNDGTTTLKVISPSEKAIFYPDGNGDYVELTIPSSGLTIINNYLTGLKLSNNGSDATNDIDVAAGVAADSTNSLMMELASALTKRLDAAWAVGTNQGGLDTGSLSTWTSTVTISNATPAVVTWNSHPLVAGNKVVFTTTGGLPTGLTAGQTYYVISTGLGADSFQVSAMPGGTAVNTSSAGSGTHTINVEKTYHVFLITRIDTGVVDALFSLSTTPTLPTDYTKYRRIGSIVRAAASIKSFIQDGDLFRWAVPVADVGHTNPGTSAVTRTLTLPTGVRVNAWVSALGAASGAATDNAGGIFLSDLSIADTPASTSAFSVFEYSGYAGAASNGGIVYCMTNTSAQIRSRVQISTAGTTLYITTHGWIDQRGKDG